MNCERVVRIMTKKKLSEKHRREISKQHILKQTNSQGITVVSEFVRGFVRRHVIEKQRNQSDLYWRPGSNVSHNINLLPQSTKIRKSKRKQLSSTDDFPIKVKRSHSKKKSFSKSIINHKPSAIPSNLPIKLHYLWNGYFQSVMSILPSKLNHNHCTNLNIIKNLDTILRLNLIGAQLKILRSTSCRAGIEGIVIMETKNTFCLATKSLHNQLMTLTTIPKLGSLFLLTLPQMMNNQSNKTSTHQKIEILLNGDHLIHRAIDRAIRKWRYIPTTAYEYNQNALTTEANFSNVLIDYVINK
ncbi:unnamed protein product [Schistosoma rodhaini]|uniref:Ribonuclease P protein subunit p29 n=2 Tax=Schistosoma rodhaini TaxID=6188 RepID=A0AA85GHX9_9TREM|nr:unnamed protein product [Schistosoma rodhaini]